MNLFWALLILIVLVSVLFWILPAVMKPETARPGISVPVQPSVADIESHASKQMLESHYEEAKAIVPEDYPSKSIGDCPYSKPMSSDLPLADVPMHLLLKTEQCKLSTLTKI